ncbi:MAG: GntR family transcriptional regulator [Parvibaculaceae bacterium]
MVAPTVLQMVRSPSLAEQAADSIVTGISSGALKPGQRLVETELASMLNMSRVPLREALKILEAQGIVESIPHRGTYVATFEDEKVNQICEARVELEKLAISDAVPKYEEAPALLADLDRIIAVMENAAERLAWIEISKADLRFHREICRASGNKVVETLWESLARQVFIVFGHEISDERAASSMGRDHRRLRDMLAEGDLAKLNSEIETHIMRLRQKRQH